MIRIGFGIENPWVNWVVERKTFMSIEKPLVGYKWLFIEFCKTPPYELISVELDTRASGRSHAGVSFEISIWCYSFEISAYDCRHWNYETGTWADRGDYEE